MDRIWLTPIVIGALVSALYFPWTRTAAWVLIGVCAVIWWMRRGRRV